MRGGLFLRWLQEQKTKEACGFGSGGGGDGLQLCEKRVFEEILRVFPEGEEMRGTLSLHFLQEFLGGAGAGGVSLK